jgi:mannose-6-phosphate isomerase-like protein (cupin superfamily)
MDVYNAKIEPTVEHGGTCLTYFMIGKEAWREKTMGSYLEYVAEFELKPGAVLEAHKHDTDEFYYLLQGTALMSLEGEDQVVGPGDLVHIPRNAVHSIRPTDPQGTFRAFSFAVSYMPEDAVGYVPVGDERP